MNFADQPENNENLAKWAFWRREFSDRLKQRGIPEEVVEGLDLFDIGDSEPMRVRASVARMQSGINGNQLNIRTSNAP